MNKPLFQRRIFWDVDFDILDYDGKAAFIIQRVFERGDVDDIRAARRYYGDGKISEALLSTKWLSLEAVYLACAVLHKEPQDFRCYTTALYGRRPQAY